MTIITAVVVRDHLREIGEAFPLSREYIRAAADKQNRRSAEQSVSGIYALLLLLERTGIDPASVRLEREPGGKPFIAGHPFHISIAHSHSLAVCALSDAAVGADVEKLRRMSDAVSLAERFFAPGEAAEVRGAQDTDFAFFRIWTRKEAVIKRSGDGIDKVLSAYNTLSEPFTEFRLSADGEYLISVTGDAEYIPTEYVSVTKGD